MWGTVYGLKIYSDSASWKSATFPLDNIIVPLYNYVAMKNFTVENSASESKGAKEIVIDASCVLAVLLGEPEAKDVLRKTDGVQLTAPDCLEAEIGNALSCLMKRKKLEVSDAVFAYHEFMKIPVRSVPLDVPSALIVAGEENIYAYDAYYIALAKRLGLALFSLDEKMKDVAKKLEVVCL